MTPKQKPDESDGRDSVQLVPLTQSAANRIAEMIHSGELQPGDRLPAERQLAADLGLSRGALREAFRTLEAAGLVEARVGSGRYVSASHSEQDSESLRVWMQLQPVGEIIAVRRILEPAAILNMPATQVASTASDASEILGEMRRALDRGEFDRAVSEHSKFHRSLTQFAATRLHRLLLASLIDAIADTQLAIFRMSGAGTQSLDRHDLIVEALEQGDVEAAAERVVDHLEPAFSYSPSQDAARSD